MNDIKILCYNGIDLSEGIDINKAICHYWYFLNKEFNFQPYVCNRCHDLLLISINLSDIAVLNIKSSDSDCKWLDWKNWNIIYTNSNFEAINVLEIVIKIKIIIM